MFIEFRKARSSKERKDKNQTEENNREQKESVTAPYIINAVEKFSAITLKYEPVVNRWYKNSHYINSRNVIIKQKFK